MSENTQPEILIVLSVAASFFFVFYSNLWEYATKNSISSLRSKFLKVFSILLLIGSGVMDIFSLQFGSISLKAPLGVLNIVISPPIGYLINDKPIERVENLVLATVGCLLCVLANSEKTLITSADQIRSNFSAPLAITYLTILSLFTLLFSTSSCVLKLTPVYNLIAAAGYSSLTTLMISTVLGLGNQATTEELALLVTFSVVCILAYFVHLQLGFRTQKVIKEKVILPKIAEFLASEDPGALDMAIFTVLSIGINALSGGIINGDFALFTPLKSVVFSFGITLAVVSVTLF